MSTIAIVGAGAIGRALSTHFARAGIDVMIANRAGPSSLANLTADLGKHVRAASIEQALAADIVFLAVPFPAVKDAVRAAPRWKGRVVVDATNALDLPDFTPSDLAGRMSTHLVAETVPGARVVKAFNTLPAAVLAQDPAQGNRRRVIFVSGDDDRANYEVAAVVERLGFAPIVLGKVAEGGRLQQWGGALTMQDMAHRPISLKT